jgi:hypothetical protein
MYDVSNIVGLWYTADEEPEKFLFYNDSELFEQNAITS